MHAALPLLALASVATAATHTLQPRQFGALGALVNDLSPACIGNIGGLALSGGLSDCLGLTTALGAFTSLGSDQSVAPTLQDYFSSQICPRPACSAQVITDANNTIANACTAQDRASNNGVNLVSTLTGILSDYEQIRQIVCLKQNTSPNYCLVDVLYLYQNQTNSNASISTLINIASGASSGSSFIASLPNPQAFCTSCVDAIASATFGSALGGPLIPNPADTSFRDGLTQGCNASFVDGSIPSDVTVALGSNTGSNTASTSNSPSASPSSPAAPALAFSPLSLAAPLALALGAVAGAVLVL